VDYIGSAQVGQWLAVEPNVIKTGSTICFALLRKPSIAVTIGSRLRRAFGPRPAGSPAGCHSTTEEITARPFPKFGASQMINI
jgi:hypothetical protein